ncbi:Gamma-glutamylputrescine oxidoreductase, partial [Haemophilus influenzae]
IIKFYMNINPKSVKKFTAL